MLCCTFISKSFFFFLPFNKSGRRPYVPSFARVGVVNFILGPNELWDISINKTPLSDTVNNAVVFTELITEPVDRGPRDSAEKR